MPVSAGGGGLAVGRSRTRRRGSNGGWRRLSRTCARAAIGQCASMPAALDGLRGAIEVPREEWERAAATLPRPVRAAIRRAAAHIRRVALAQRPRGFRATIAAGVTVEQRVIPLDAVGCYVPGGRYPLPSSLLMTAIPARVAGVGAVVAVSPRPHPAVLAAAIDAGVDRFFQIGGAHAIAALAHGTTTVPRVDKIVGPGNQWVAAAKALVSRRLRDRLLCRTHRDPDRRRARTGRLGRRRSHRAGRTRSRRAGGADHLEPSPGGGGRPARERTDAGRRSRPPVARAARRGHRHPNGRRGDGARQ